MRSQGFSVPAIRLGFSNGRRFSKSASAARSTLKSGTYMLVYKTNGNWAYVKSMSGKSGYVKLSSIRKVF